MKALLWDVLHWGLSRPFGHDRGSKRWRGVQGALLFLCVLLLSMPEPASTQAQPPAEVSTSGPDAAPTPVPPGPLEILPSTGERILAPVPQQFNWLRREAPSDLLTESFLSLRGPARFTISASLIEEASDNFDHDPTSRRRVDFRTGAAITAVYQFEEGARFLSLLNTVRGFYEPRTERKEIGFANLFLNAGYRLPRLSFGLSNSFVREDNTALNRSLPTATQSTTLPSTTQGNTFTFLRARQKFIRNSFTPQARYAISPFTNVGAAYTNSVVIDEDGTQGLTVSHTVNTDLQHQFSRDLVGSAIYTFSTSAGRGGSGGNAHRVTGNMVYTYGIDVDTSAIVSAFATLIERSAGDDRIAQRFGASLGIRRRLFQNVSLFASVGPTVYRRTGEDPQIRASWNVALDGPLPIFATPTLTLTVTTQQSIQDTFGEVNDVGLVLQQLVSAQLNYRPTIAFTGTLFVSYVRNQLLEGGVRTAGARQGRTDNLWSAGVTSSYALTRIFALTGEYRYQRRNSDLVLDDFEENRLTLALTGTFPVF